MYFQCNCFGREVERNFEVKIMFYSETGGHVLTPDFDTYEIDIKKGRNQLMRRNTEVTIGNRPIGATIEDRPIGAVVFRRMELVEIGRLGGWSSWANMGLK